MYSFIISTVIFGTLVALVFIFAKPYLKNYKKIYLAKVVTNFAEICNKVMRERKQQLFDEAFNSIKNKQATLDVLEIGAGPGANFDFYPQGTRITCLEPNEFFEQALRKSVDKQDGRVTLTKLITGRGEEMSDVADCSMDACVCTYVLCSVDDPQLVIKEIKRVLKPGGKFLFLEHVSSDDKWPRIFQNIIHYAWYNICDCFLTRQTRSIVESSGFSETKIQSFFASEYSKAASGVTFSVVVKLVGPHVSGYAIK